MTQVNIRDILFLLVGACLGIIALFALAESTFPVHRYLREVVGTWTDQSATP